MEKYIAFLFLGLVAFFSPILGTLALIAFLCLSDLLLGILAAIKENKFSWDKLPHKIINSFAYFIFVFVFRSIELYLNEQVPLVKGLCIVLVGIELDSMRKKALILTGKDVFKFLVNFIEKKRDKIN